LLLSFLLLRGRRIGVHVVLVWPKCSVLSPSAAKLVQALRDLLLEVVACMVHVLVRLFQDLIGAFDLVIVILAAKSFLERLRLVRPGRSG